jgi:signal transduction histidine kinase
MGHVEAKARREPVPAPFSKQVSRMVLAGLVLLFPLVVFLAILVREGNRSIDVTKAELDGVTYISALRPLGRLLAEHRGLANTYLAGRGDVGERITDLAGRIDGEFTRLIKEFPRETRKLKAQRRVVELRLDWLQVNENWPSMERSDAFSAHTDLISGLFQLIRHVANTFMLILDGDLESYHLMDLMVNRLLQTGELVGRLRGLAAGAMASPDPVSSQTTRDIQVFQAQVMSEYDTLFYDLNVAIEKEPAIAAAVASSLVVFERHYRQFVEATDPARGFSAAGEKNAMAVFEAGTKTIDAVHAIHDVITPELRRLLEDRIDRRLTERYVYFSLAVLAALLAAAAGVAFVRLMTETLREQVEIRSTEAFAKARDVELLQRITRAANESTSIDGALESCIEDVRRFTGWPLGQAYMVADDGSCQLQPVLPDLERGQVGAMPANQMEDPPGLAGIGLPRRVLNAREAIWVTDVAVDAAYRDDGAGAGDKLHGTFGFPVMMNDEIVAVLEFCSIEREEPSYQTLDMMSNIGTQIGRAVERARAEAAMLRAVERAEEASRVKSKFLSGMSHELRTPLNAVIGMSQILRMDLDDRPATFWREELDVIHDNGMELLSMVDNILRLAALDEYDDGTTIQVVDVTSIVQGSLDDIRPDAENRKLAVTGPDSARRPFLVKGDPDQIKPVLGAVLSNAVKYTPGEGQVRVSVENRDGVGGPMVRITVSDTGPGIPEEYRARVFVPFERLDNYNGNVAGAGVSLSLAQRSVEKMHGHLDYKNQPDEGCQFWIDLPAA